MRPLKLIAIAATLLLISSNSFAQAFKWEFAIESGAGIRTMRIDPKYPSLESKAGIGFMTGIAGQYNFDDMWSLKLGAAYERKGADLERSDIMTTGKFNTDYISIPLLLKTKFGKKIKFYVNAGPYLGIFLSSKTKLDVYSAVPAVEIDNDSSSKKTDFGISGGIGIEIPLGRCGAFTIELRDNVGLRNISESKETNSPEIKLNTANLMIGYVFKFGRTISKTK